MSRPFVPLRTGDNRLDRVQQRLQQTSHVVQQQIDAVSANVNPPSSVKTVSASYRIAASDNVVQAVNVPAAGMTLVFPDAITLKGRKLTINFASVVSGTPTLTLQAQSVRGRQQTIAGSASVGVTTHSPFSFVSNGSDWVQT